MSPIPREKLPKPKKRYHGFMWRYHGNYVGPGWSAGKYQKSVVSDVPAVDEFDETAKEHDAAYALGKNLKKADYKFFRQNWGKGWKRSAAAAAVGLQGYFRGDEQTNHSSSSNATMPAVRRLRLRSGKQYRIKPVVKKSRRKSVSKPTKMEVDAAKPGKMMHSRKGTKAGFLKTKIRRRKYRKTRIAKQRFAGACTIKRETGSIIDGGVNTAYIGHASSNVGDLQRAAWIAIYNKLMFKACITAYDSVNSAVTFDANTSVNIQYRIDAAGIANEQWVPGAVSVTPQTFVTWAINNARPWNADTQSVTRFEFLRISINCSTYNAQIRTNTEVNLFSLKLKYSCKSALKLQNRTKTSSTDVSADTVDEVPLKGKGYYGKGQGPTLNDPTITQSFVAEANTGVIKLSANPTQSALQEPPEAYDFAKVKSYGKVYIDPGHIKTSLLKDNRTMYFNTLYSLLSVRRTDAKLTNAKFGTFRLFALEKMINVDATVIKIAYELQTDTVVSVYETKRQLQAVYFTGSVV